MFRKSAQPYNRLWWNYFYFIDDIVPASYASGYPLCQTRLVGVRPNPLMIAEVSSAATRFTNAFCSFKSQQFSDIRLEVSNNASHKTKDDLIAIRNERQSWGNINSQVPTRWWKDALWESTVSATFETSLPSRLLHSQKLTPAQQVGVDLCDSRDGDHQGVIQCGYQSSLWWGSGWGKRSWSALSCTQRRLGRCGSEKR